MTQYVVLYNDKTDDEDVWQFLGHFDGPNAAKQAALKHGHEGHYVQLPARSWAPVRLQVETNPRVKVVK